MPLKIVVGGVAGGDDFYDREELLERIWQRLPGQSVELVAPRRFGKTSVMKRLVDEPRNGCRVLFIDCEHFESPEKFATALEKLLSSLTDRLSGWRREVGRFLGRIKVVKRDGIELGDSDSSRISVSVQELLHAAAAHPGPTVVILDEFSMMLENLIEKKKVPVDRVVDLLTWFRNLRQTQDANTTLTFVVGGSMSLDYWLGRLKASALMNDFHREQVPPFTNEVALNFLEALREAEQLAWAADAPAKVFEQIEPPLPYWIQLLVLLVSQDPGRSRQITAADVQKAYEERLIGPAGRHYFQSYKERLDRYDPETLRAVHRILSHLALQFPMPLKRNFFEGVFGDPTGTRSPDLFDGVFADLQSEFYISYDLETDECVFTHKVLRDWWLRWHPSAVAEARGQARRNG